MRAVPLSLWLRVFRPVKLHYGFKNGNATLQVVPSGVQWPSIVLQHLIGSAEPVFAGPLLSEAVPTSGAEPPAKAAAAPAPLQAIAAIPELLAIAQPPLPLAIAQSPTPLAIAPPPLPLAIAATPELVFNPRVGETPLETNVLIAVEKRF